MLLIYYLSLKTPLLLAVSYILQVIPYYLLMKKFGFKPWYALIPNLAEYKLSRLVFPRRRTFFRPLILTALMLGFAWYVNPYKGVGILYMLVAFLVWGIFLARLYAKLCKACGKKDDFALGAIVLPPVFLTILGRSQAEFTAPVFPEPKPCSKAKKAAKQIGFVVLSVAEVLVLVAGCGYLAIQSRLPGFLISWNLDDTMNTLEDVGATGELVTREDVLGSDLAAAEEAVRTRDYYCADHSSDQTVNVFVYMIGSNLENDSGCASLNIRQMIEATKQGSGLRFIVEAGGSERWFTKGIKNSSYGRYEIADGKLTQVDTLDSGTNMVDAQVLTDFLSWAKENYNADRNLLLLWDHGGGVAYGYGQDDLNGSSSDLLPVSDIANSIGQSGMTFDIIGFDACLMQDVEAAAAFAPYADYYIASEETEPGTGWFYTPAFSDLAKDPGMSSEDFAKEVVASYDAGLLALSSTGELDPGVTLSVVDLSVIEGACDKLSAFLDNAADKMKDDPECFADVSTALANTYDFSTYQLDLIGFLKILDAMDYDESVASNEEMEELIQSLQAAVVCRDGASAEGINGLAFAMPYNDISKYDYTSKDLTKLSMTGERHAFDVIFSIIAAQQMKTGGNVLKDFAANSSLLSLIVDYLPATDYSQYDWYISGFEDYDDSDQFIDIPLIEVENGWQVDLPEKTWNIVTDVQTLVYQDVENDKSGAVRRYIGSDYIGDADENGNTLIAADDNWPHINGQLVCYQSDKVQITDNGEVYTGKVKAMLNGSTPIYIWIQWDAEVEGQAMTAHVLGYEIIDDEDSSEMPDKGYHELQAGDSIQFMFDYFDAEGNLVDTRTEGSKIRISSQDRLKITDEPLESCTIEFGGILTDIYQRVMTTEMVTVEIN